MQNKNKFYITTPIYYATAKPHLGSLYSTLLADIVARWNKLKGNRVFFLTGTDEHGQKIALEAQKAGKEPQVFVDSFINDYKHIWKIYNIDYDRFIRTTEKEHIKAVQNWVSLLIAKGEIYKSAYEGWYCTPDETFVTDPLPRTDLNGNPQSPLCPTCGRETIFVSEESYFFKLSSYQDKLLKFFKEHPDFVVPKERLNEIIKFVESGLKDLSISRTTVKWGVPFPGDNKHVAYVWADALLNYVSAIGYNGVSSTETEKLEFAKWWPADLQVMGKDILRFHAVYWPAFLMASDLPLPKQLLAHGWIKVNHQKMSKSLGNVIDPEPLFEKYGSDAVRYYLAGQIAITQDGEFSTQALERHIETDLANDLGNLLNRTVALAFKHELINVPEVNNLSPESVKLLEDTTVMLREYTDYMDRCYFHLAIASLWRFIAKVNAYFHNLEPWKLAKTDKNKFIECISLTCNSLNIIGNLVWPIMPSKSEELLDSLGEKFALGTNKIDELTGNKIKSFTLKKGATLFKKIEDTETPEVTKPETNLSTSQPARSEYVEGTQDIDFAHFEKIKLVMGTIEACDEVPKSDKLYKLKVNFGDKGTRQVLSGVKKFFKPEDLIGKQALFVYNLAPRKMMGLDSQGMLLTAQNSDGSLQIVTVLSQVHSGTELK